MRASQRHEVPQYAGFYRALAFHWGCLADLDEATVLVYWGTHRAQTPHVDTEAYWRWSSP